MIEMEEIAENIYRLRTPVAGLDIVFSVYFLPAGKGVLIEPGPAAAVPAIQEGMKHLGMEELAYIIPTHIHLDHAGGIGRLAQLFPQARVVLHPEAVKHAVDPSRLIRSTRMALGDDFEARYGPILPIPESQVKVPQDGETISASDRVLQIIYAPGHAAHHVAIFDRKTGGVFCGEALGMLAHNARSPLPSVAPPGFDMEAYLETMEKLRSLRPRQLFYSHDGVGKEPEELISAAAQNTRIFADIILGALKRGKTPQAIDGILREYISTHFGPASGRIDTAMIVSGYAFYFKKKGLV